jgi:hypothetical protein
MAYKQKGFPQHINTISRSPAQGWDWWDENVSGQGYGEAAVSGASTGAAIGSIVPGVGNVVGGIVGGIVGAGVQYFKNENEKYDDLGEKVDYSDRIPDGTLVESAETEEEKQERWQKMTDKRSFNKDLESNITKGLNNPELMAKAQERIRKKEQGRYDPNPAKPVDQSTTHLTNWNEMLKKSSPATQLTPPNRGGRPIESNALNPMSSTLSALNGSDSTNLAVKYNQFNNIAQNLDEGLQSDNT